MIIQIGAILFILSLLTFLFFDNQYQEITDAQKTICKAMIAISIAIISAGFALEIYN